MFEHKTLFIEHEKLNEPVPGKLSNFLHWFVEKAIINFSQKTSFDFILFSQILSPKFSFFHVLVSETKLFTAVSYDFSKYDRPCVPGKAFQPRIMFARKACQGQMLWHIMKSRNLQQ